MHDKMLDNCAHDKFTVGDISVCYYNLEKSYRSDILHILF
jgi:hypothetical protein